MQVRALLGVLCVIRTIAFIEAICNTHRRRRSFPDAAGRILFVTGDVAGTDAEQFLEETGCRWLAKPFRLKDLLRTAKEIVG